MTFSILARDPTDGTIGCAAATGNLAVGAWVLRAEAGLGAAATQGALVSSLWGDSAVDHLRAGAAPVDAVSAITAADHGRGHRQLAVLDAQGQVASFTGDDNKPARGERSGSGWVITGNWLSSDAVLDAMAVRWVSSDSERMPFARRLIAVLDAAREAGGDERGCLSAALKVVHPERATLDLRVDYDESPIARLLDLYERAMDPTYRAWTDRLPTLAEPHQC